MKNDEGYDILSRAQFHIWNAGMSIHAPITIDVLDNCRRQILVEAYPNDVDIAQLLTESKDRLKKNGFTRIG